MYKNVKLNEIAIFKNGKKKPDEIGEIPVYGGNGIFGYTNEFNQEKVLIIGRVGAYCGSVHYEPNLSWVSDNAIAVKNIKGISDILYLKYLLKTLQLNRRRIGTSQPLLTQSILKDISVKVPNLKTQELIANILSSFDNKIENNNAIIANLEEQTQTIFKSWFVDFEPFQDMEFVESELGEIPVNWSIICLKDLSEITMGQSPKSENYNIEGMGYPFMQGNTAFGEKFGIVEKYTTKANKYAEVKDILLSVRAPVGDMNINIFPQLAIGRGLSSIRPDDSVYGYIYYYLDYYINKIVAKGTGTVFSSINKKDLESFPILLPNAKIQLEKFNGLVETILDYQINLFKQNEKLVKVRDTLLPKLMSGEIRVGEVVTEE